MTNVRKHREREIKIISFIGLTCCKWKMRLTKVNGLKHNDPEMLLGEQASDLTSVHP